MVLGVPIPKQFRVMLLEPVIYYRLWPAERICGHVHLRNEFHFSEIYQSVNYIGSCQVNES